MIGISENWYPDASDEANLVIWSGMMDRMSELNMPSLMLHFVHEIMHEWYPGGDLATFFMQLARQYETSEEAFNVVTDEVLEHAAMMMDKWLAKQDAQTRESNVMKMPDIAGLPSVAPDPHAPDDDGEFYHDVPDQTEAERRINKDFKATLEDVLSAEDLEEAFAAGAESVKCRDAAPHNPVDPEKVMARMFGPPLPPRMLEDRLRRDVEIMPHDRDYVVLGGPREAPVGPMLVLGARKHACMAVDYAGDQDAAHRAIRQCAPQQIYKDGQPRNMVISVADQFAAMAGATGGLQVLCSRKDNPPDRRELDVGTGRHALVLAAAAEITLATGDVVGTLRKPDVGRNGKRPVTNSWLIAFRIKRDDLARHGYARYRVEDAQARRLRARYAWCRDFYEGEQARVQDYRLRGGTEEYPRPRWASAVSAEVRNTVLGAGNCYSTATELRAYVAEARAHVRCTLVEMRQHRWFVDFGGTEEDFWDVVERATCPWGGDVLIQCTTTN